LYVYVANRNILLEVNRVEIATENSAFQVKLKKIFFLCLNKIVNSG